jgi:hypothetical protein
VNIKDEMCQCICQWRGSRQGATGKTLLHPKVCQIELLLLYRTSASEFNFDRSPIYLFDENIA